MKLLFLNHKLLKKNYKLSQIAIISLFVLLSACFPDDYRSELTLQDMFASTLPTFVPNDFFLPIGDHNEAFEGFSGSIIIPEHSMVSNPIEIIPKNIYGKKPQLFPEVKLEFISSGGYLIPLERDLIIPSDTNSYWQIQVSPGRIWSESADSGMSRASFPFLLTSIIENESYNGIATFLYDEESISSLRYQIVSQLSPFVIQTHFFATGQTEVTYQR